MSAPESLWTMADVLAAVGSKVSGGDKILDALEARSSLDHVRHAALSNNAAKLKARAPVLLSEGLQEESFYIHRHPTSDEQYVSKECQLDAIADDIGVAGGCMMQTSRGHFPAAVLVSAKSSMVVLYVPKAPLSTFEADLFDSAFEDPNKAWETKVLGERDAKPVLGWRKEAAIQCRTSGIENMPQMLLKEGPLRVSRFGPLPYLGLRLPSTSSERNAVVAMMASLLAHLPEALPIDRALRGKKDVGLHTIFDSGSFVPPKTPREDMCCDAYALAGMTCDRPVLVPLAAVILRSVVDGATDAAGEQISEASASKVQRMSGLATICETEGSKERAELLAAKNSKRFATPLQDKQGATGWTVPSIMAGLNRAHAMRSLYKGECVRQGLEAVATAIFPNDEITRIGMIVSGIAQTAMTIGMGIALLAREMVDRQAIVICTREHDGRIVNARLCSPKVNINKLSKAGLSRLSMCPWAFVIMLTRDEVQQLMVREPTITRGVQPFERETPKLAPVSTATAQQEADAGHASGAHSGAVMQKLEQMSAQLQTIGSGGSVLSIEQRTIMASLKRTRAQLEAFHERVSAP